MRHSHSDWPGTCPSSEHAINSLSQRSIQAEYIATYEEYFDLPCQLLALDQHLSHSCPPADKALRIEWLFAAQINVLPISNGFFPAPVRGAVLRPDQKLARNLLMGELFNALPCIERISNDSRVQSTAPGKAPVPPEQACARHHNGKCCRFEIGYSSLCLPV